MNMNPEVKAKWTARLRELPNDMQATGVLKNSETGKMCCLGVLTEIAVEDGVIPAGHVYDSNKKTISYTDDLENGETIEWWAITPPTVAKWAGLDDENPTLDDGLPASEWNDFKGATFDEIADMIERNL